MRREVIISCPPLSLETDYHSTPSFRGDSPVPLVAKATTAAHVGFRRQYHELLDKTQAALKSPAVVCNDENIPNLA